VLPSAHSTTHHHKCMCNSTIRHRHLAPTHTPPPSPRSHCNSNLPPLLSPLLKP
jgi:hypothetical protein